MQTVPVCKHLHTSPDQVGAGSVEVLLDMIEGNEPEMETAVDAVVVTPENYKEEMGSYAE